MNNTQINQMTNEQIHQIYTNRSIISATLNNAYRTLRNQFGADNDAVKAMWNLYLQSDEDLRPFQVRMGQISMQEQIDIGMDTVNDPNFNS